MIFNFKKIEKLLKKKIEILFLLLLVTISIVSMSFYNNNKKLINNNYKNTVNNIYFKKTIDHIFNNLTPRYKSISHKISSGETFDKILKSYSITSDEILRFKKDSKNNQKKFRNCISFFFNDYYNCKHYFL